MADYRTPLPRLLAVSLETAINAALDTDPGSAARLERMDGKCLRLDLEGLAITLFVRVAWQGVRVSLDGPEEPDAIIAGTPAALMGMASGNEDDGWAIEGARVRLSGDATLARDFERLFSRLDPDWTGYFSGLTNERIGPQIAIGLREGLRQSRTAFDSGGRLLAEWLGGDGRVGVRPDEMARFVDDVDRLRDDTERLAARVNRLKDSNEC